jgi:transcriptional regulator GlxA family with amidase domain
MHMTYLLYEGIEPVDLAAIGVMSMAKRVIPELTYETVAATRAPVVFSNGLRVVPDRLFDDVSNVDVLLVPGGPGWRKASDDPVVVSFIRRVASSGLACSICTGAMILAAAGVLDGHSATTKVEVVDPEVAPLSELAARYPNVAVRRALAIDEESVVTGGGVTLCIDTTLHLLERRYGSAKVDEVARIMEYTAARRANRSRFLEMS